MSYGRDILEAALRKHCEAQFMPELPPGYDRWVYRGMGWNSVPRIVWICYLAIENIHHTSGDIAMNRRLFAKQCHAVGQKNLLYWEAVEDDEPRSITIPIYEL